MRSTVSNTIAAALFAAVVLICSPVARGETGQWSAAVNGLRGRLTTKEDKPFESTRMIAVYLELENVSDIGNPLELYFDPTNSVVSKVVDESGKPLAEPPTAADIISGPPYWLALPWDGSMRFRVSISGYGVYKNSGTNVQMMSGNWLIKPGDKQNYYLEARLITHPPENDRRHSWKGELVLPRVLVPH